jgi:hypothetical protein
MMERTRILVATIWAGSLWTVGGLVAPILFCTLFDRVLAGTIAASLFRAEAWVCVVCGIFLAASLKFQRTTSDIKDVAILMRLILAMLACTLIGYFALHPFMAALRDAAGAGGVMDTAGRTQFGILHGAATGFYLIESLLAVALILKMHAGRVGLGVLPSTQS